MGGLDRAINVVAIETTFNFGKGLLEATPGRADSDMKAIIADRKDEVLSINSEFLKYISYVPCEGISGGGVTNQTFDNSYHADKT
jgi:hypothetical protein